MGRQTEIRQPPTGFLMVQRPGGRRTRRVALGAVVAAVVLGVGGAVVLRDIEESQRAALESEWGALGACLLGDPLRPGEAASARVRSIQLTVLGTPRDRRAKTGDLAWPASCGALATALAEHAEPAGAGGSELRASATALARAMRDDGAATADIGKLVDRVWKDASARNLRASSPAAPGVPRPAVAYFERDVLHEPSGLSGEFPLSSVKPEPSPERGLRFLIDDSALAGGAVLCSAGGAPAHLSCAHVAADAASHTPGLSLLGTVDPDAQPWVFAGGMGQLGIFRPGGTAAFTGDVAVGSTVGRDGSDWLLLHRGASTVPTELELVHAGLGGDVSHGRAAIDPGELDAVTDASLAWSWLVARTGEKGHPPAHLIARKLSETGDIGPVVDIGDAASLDRLDRDDRQPRFVSCKSGSSIAVRAHGPRSDLVTFFTGDRWTAPLPLATRGGVMACHGDEAVVTQVSRVVDGEGTHPTVEQSRCTAPRAPPRAFPSARCSRGRT